MTGVEPHDFSILRQDWLVHETYGKVTPIIPQEKCVDQSVLILGLPVSVTIAEITPELYIEDMHPKKVNRFKIRGTQDDSTTEMVSFASMEQKQKMINQRFHFFHQSFTVVEFKEDPVSIITDSVQPKSRNV